jgi:tRNA dimethylallyltransferase
LDGEIIGADALQIYRDVPVATCQPTAEELSRVKHHLVGVLASSESMTAARFGSLAREIAVDLRSRGKRVILAGGTGLYLRAALEGLVPAPSADAALRAELVAEAERGGRAALHARLSAIDPESGARLNPNDLTRVVRALEVHALSGMTQTELYRRHQKDAPTAQWFAIEVAREALNERLDARTQRLFPGLLDEARALEAGGAAGSAAARALGIPEALRSFKGELSTAEALAATQQVTRRYAKRQGTWFRSNAAIRWLPEERLDLAALARELANR